MTGRKIIDKAHHRNGISGAPFDAIIFKDGKDKMIGIVFEEQGYCAVFNKDLLDQDIIEFGENSFRGDVYQDSLKMYIGD